MSKHTLNAVEIAEQILQLLKNGDMLNNAGGNDEVVQEKIASILITAGFPEREVLTKNVTILLSDIRGFSAIAQAHSPKVVVGMLNRYFSCMGDIISQYGGVIDKLMGDSILVLFGLPTPNKKDVEKALACAVEMQIAMTKYNEQNQSMGLPPLYMGIGINSGNVVVGDLGSKHYNEYTVIGDEVNLTSRIEAHCLRGQILISENTYKLAKDTIEVGEPNSVEVKGTRAAVNLYELFATNIPRAMEVPRREGRKSPRIAVSMSVVFQCLSGKIVQPEKHQARAVDISYHGLLVETDIKLGSLSEIKMSLYMELFSDKTTDVYARIINTTDVGGKYRSNMEFTSINSEGQAAIKKFVDKLVLTL